MPIVRQALRADASFGLSPRTLDLWLEAMRYRRLADELAAADARRAAQ